MLDFIFRLGVFLYLGCGVRWAKCWLQRLLTQWDFRGTKLNVVADFQRLAAFRDTFIWVPDGAAQLWDAIPYPGYVEHVAGHGDKKVGDCSAYASYLTEAVRYSRMWGNFRDVTDIALLTVVWRTAAGGYGGHDVALFRMGDNWAYMDYESPRRFTSLPDCVLGVMQYYGGVECLGWAVADSATLWPREAHFSA